jgi:hypothetical protein
MNHQRKLTSQSQTDEQQQATGEQKTQQPAAREFATPEAMLRHDALHTPVPPAIAQRLQKSIDQSPPAARSWWRRLLGGSKS